MKTPPLPFTTDGCSGGMSWLWRKLFGKPPPWEGACIAHDQAYWRGGSLAQRRVADKALCIGVVKRGYPLTGALMYYGVRLGGVPWLPTSWRWGYGYGRRFGRYGEGS